jgi:hypothetical protein
MRVNAPPARVRASHSMPTTAANKRAAVKDAAHLLAGVVAPDGSVVRSSRSGTGPKGDHLLTAAFASAYALRSWTVKGDGASVISFVTGHLPAGSTVVSQGSGSGPGSTSESITYSWPPVPGVLNTRWLEVTVSTTGKGTSLSAESQSEWVVTRRADERIPAGVHEVVVTDGWPGKAPFFSRRVENRAKVGALVRLFDSLGVGEPGAISCPSMRPHPMVAISFEAGTGRQLAQATSGSDADFSWPASLPGWACYPVGFSVLGRNRPSLAGNVITPTERILHITLSKH